MFRGTIFFNIYFILFFLRRELKNGSQVFRITMTRHNNSTGENFFNHLSFIRLSAYHQEQRNFFTTVSSILQYKKNDILVGPLSL